MVGLIAFSSKGVARAADTAITDVPAVLTACSTVGIAPTIRSGSDLTSTVGSGITGGVSDLSSSFLGSLTGGGFAAGGSAGLGAAGLKSGGSTSGSISIGLK
jgi:hypothetical protein